MRKKVIPASALSRKLSKYITENGKANYTLELIRNCFTGTLTESTGHHTCVELCWQEGLLLGAVWPEPLQGTWHYLWGDRGYWQWRLPHTALTLQQMQRLHRESQEIRRTGAGTLWDGHQQEWRHLCRLHDGTWAAHPTSDLKTNQDGTSIFDLQWRLSAATHWVCKRPRLALQKCLNCLDDT